MNTQVYYWLLIGAIVLMLVAIIWQLSRGRGVSVGGVKVIQAPSPVLPPSQDQRVRDHVAPIFDDMIDKERATAVATRLYNAYKGDSTSDTVTGIGSQVKGGQSASAN